MIETLATTAIQETLKNKTSEQDPTQLVEELTQQLGQLDVSSDADVFRQLLEAYPSSNLAENIKASNARGTHRKKRGLLDDAVDAINGISGEWRETLNRLSRGGKAPQANPQEYLEVSFALNKTSTMLSLVGTLVGKSVQHLETLLRMQ